MIRALGRLNAKRRIAARTAAASLMVFALNVVGQGKKRLGPGQGPLDQIRGQVMIGHNGKAIAGQGCANCGRKAGQIAVIAP